MEVHDEYVEVAGKQPSRGQTPLGGLFLFGVVLVSGGFAVFGKGLLQSHFLSQEIEQSKKTVVLNTDGSMWIEPVFEVINQE
jgi:hypothetical protein